MPKLYDYARENNYKIIGDPIEMCHLDIYETADENEFISEIELMVESS